MKDAATGKEIIVEEEIRVTEREEIIEADIEMMEDIKINGNKKDTFLSLNFPHLKNNKNFLTKKLKSLNNQQNLWK